LLDEYQIQCQFCKRAFPKRDVIHHETFLCKNTLCANELCGIALDSLPQENLVKFIVASGGSGIASEQVSSLAGDYQE
jgi:hypothetical protein